MMFSSLRKRQVREKNFKQADPFDYVLEERLWNIAVV